MKTEITIGVDITWYGELLKRASPHERYNGWVGADGTLPYLPTSHVPIPRQMRSCSDGGRLGLDDPTTEDLPFNREARPKYLTLLDTMSYISLSISRYQGN